MNLIMDSSELPKVSIIIPFYKNFEHLAECVSHCLNLDYPDYEVIVVSNVPLNIDNQNVRVIITDKIGQADKKDLGTAEATGEIYAFLDDDAYPSEDWIRRAVKYFDDPNVAAVGGPGITPPNDNLMQLASGVIYSSFIGGGSLGYRYAPKNNIVNVDELPGYNLFIRRSALDRTSFNVKFRSGEDSVLSRRLKGAGGKLVYASDVVVYHHRRPLFTPHLKQAANYALHRGFFVKKFPKTSAKPIYAIPSASLIALLGLLAFSFSLPILRFLIVTLLITYLSLSFISAVWTSKNLKPSLLALIGIPLTHLTYAVYFLKGLLSKEIGERPSY